MIKEIDEVVIKELIDESPFYFQFEEDFIEEGIRCIPMIVRFKLDACGIKLKLSEWSKLSINERDTLCELECNKQVELKFYRNYLRQLVYNYTGKEATELKIDTDPGWAHTDEIPFSFQQELAKYHWKISLPQWKSLSNLKRFALMKLSKAGHENKNFPKAVKEFGLV
jgi:hypothetical protein